MPGMQALTLDALIDYRPDAFAAVDIGAMNLACAVGLPGAEDVGVDNYLAILAFWVHVVDVATMNNWSRFVRGEANAKSEADWRMLVLTTVLQKQFGVRYNLDRVTREDWSDSRDLFIHGLLGPTRTGTCPSLPTLIVSIGRRLGYPLKLVLAPGHVFCRWDDKATGERFNIECHGRGMVSDPDEYYLTWPRRWPPELIELERERGERANFLRSLEPAEEFAEFLALRGHCLEAHGRTREAQQAYEAAVRLAPHRHSFSRFLNDLRHGIPYPHGMLQGGTIRAPGGRVMDHVFAFPPTPSRWRFA